MVLADFQKMASSLSASSLSAASDYAGDADVASAASDAIAAGAASAPSSKVARKAAKAKEKFEKTSQLIAQLQASQSNETALYESLKRTGLTDAERTNIIRQINEQAATRTAAYDQLAVAYAERTNDTNLLTAAASQQLEALRLVEQQLNKTKLELTDKRLEALKMVEITAYSGLQYKAYASFLAAVATVAILYILASWVSGKLVKRRVPFSHLLPTLVLLVGVIYLITRVFDLLLRRNDVYDEYAFPAAPRTLDGLDKANTASNKSIIQVDGLPTLCVGSYCCTEGTEWVDDKGCVVSASAPKPVPALNGQELTSKLAKA